MWILSVAFSVVLVFCLCVIYFQNETITKLTSECNVYSLKHNPERAHDIHHHEMAYSDSSVSDTSTTKKRVYEGVAITLMLGSPRWFQNRYTMMVNLMAGALPRGWVIQIFYLPGKKMSLEAVSYPGILKQVAKGNVVLTPVPKKYASLRKKDLMMTPWLWKRALADRVLTFGGTNTLCANSFMDLSRNFTSSEVDYVGTPWRDVANGMGGDGGLSIRDRSTVLRTLYTYNNKEGEQQRGKEDGNFVKSYVLNGGKKLASREQTLNFGMNDNSKDFTCDETECPLGAQGTLVGMSDESRIKALEYCPELKMFFPVLHASACFGAKPQPLQCFKFLCELGGLKCDEDTQGQLNYKVGKKASKKLGTLTIKVSGK